MQPIDSPGESAGVLPARRPIGVLFLHSQLYFGADSAIHSHLMRHLDRTRFQVHVACTRGDGTGVPPALAKLRAIPDVTVRPTSFAPGLRGRSGASVLRQLRSAAAFPIDFAALVEYVRRKRIRIIHGTDRPRDSTYTVTLGRLTGAKSVVHVHVAWAHGYSAPAKWAVRNADAVFGISRFVTETVVSTGTPRQRVHTVLNAIDPVGWDPHIDGMGVRQELGIPLDAPVLASVSRLFPEKGQRELLRAVALVRERVPNVHLMVVGADYAEITRGGFTRELKELAHELRIDDAVVFTGERQDIPRVMAACDVFTMPSFQEPFGLVYLEAMAMQRPVVSVDNGGTPEVVEHGRSGLLSKYQDVEALAANIVTLVENRDLRARMGAYGRSRVLDYFNATRMANDAGAAYEAVLGR
jgi:glycosyltransferase involved in cell wall biosynthesis